MAGSERPVVKLRTGGARGNFCVSNLVIEYDSQQLAIGHAGIVSCNMPRLLEVSQ
jgi:hypothetical protein